MSLKVGVAGARRGSGPAAVFHSHKDCELVAIADRLDDVRNAAADRFDVPAEGRYEDFTDLLDTDLDLIYVATPMPLHAEHCIAALQAGKHVMSECPAVCTIEEAQALVAAVNASDAKYSFAENMAYFPYVQMYRDLVEAGELGEIVYAEGEYIHTIDSLKTDRPDGMGGGVDGKLTWRGYLHPIQYLTHDLGPLLQMFGDRCVTAVGMSPGSRRKPELGVADLEVGLFQTTKNITIKQLCGFSVAKEPAHHWFTIYGTEGQIEQSRHEVKPGHSTHYLYREKYTRLNTPMEFHVPSNDPSAPPEATVGGHGTSEYFMVNEFVQAVLNDTKPPIDVYEGLDMTLPGICAKISIDRGSQPVEVPNPRDWA